MSIETALNDGPDPAGSSALNSATTPAGVSAESRQSATPDEEPLELPARPSATYAAPGAAGAP